jgi:hypothetical protein
LDRKHRLASLVDTDRRSQAMLPLSLLKRSDHLHGSRRSTHAHDRAHPAPGTTTVRTQRRRPSNSSSCIQSISGSKIFHSTRWHAQFEKRAAVEARNYRVVGVRASVYYDAALRNLFAFWEDEGDRSSKRQPPSGQNDRVADGCPRRHVLRKIRRAPPAEDRQRLDRGIERVRKGLDAAISGSSHALYADRRPLDRAALLRPQRP